MASVPSVKGDFAAAVSFPQTLRAVSAALAVAPKSIGGITGLSKVLLATETIDAILKATEIAPGERTSAVTDGHQRFDLGEPFPSAEAGGAVARQAAMVVDDGVAHRASAATSDAVPMAEHVGASEEQATVEGRPRDPGSGVPAQRAVVDLGPNAALLREAGGLLLTEIRAVKRSRIPSETCPRCGKERIARRCACRSVPWRPVRR